MNTVYTVVATTESSDDYMFAFRNRPSRDDIVKFVHNLEGKTEDLRFYQETLSVRVEETEIIEN